MQPRIKEAIQNSVELLSQCPDFPVFVEGKGWKLKGRGRFMKNFVQTNGGKIPEKWAWEKMFGVLDSHLSNRQIESFFNELGFEVGQISMKPGRKSK